MAVDAVLRELVSNDFPVIQGKYRELISLPDYTNELMTVKIPDLPDFSR